MWGCPIQSLQPMEIQCVGAGQPAVPGRRDPPTALLGFMRPLNGGIVPWVLVASRTSTSLARPTRVGIWGHWDPLAVNSALSGVLQKRWGSSGARLSAGAQTALSPSRLGWEGSP